MLIATVIMWTITGGLNMKIEENKIEVDMQTKISLKTLGDFFPKWSGAARVEGKVPFTPF